MRQALLAMEAAPAFMVLDRGGETLGGRRQQTELLKI